jgi:hypothetical protein
MMMIVVRRKSRRRVGLVRGLGGGGSAATAEECLLGPLGVQLVFAVAVAGLVGGLLPAVVGTAGRRRRRRLLWSVACWETAASLGLLGAALRVPGSGSWRLSVRRWD